MTTLQQVSFAQIENIIKLLKIDIKKKPNLYTGKTIIELCLTAVAQGLETSSDLGFQLTNCPNNICLSKMVFCKLKSFKPLESEIFKIAFYHCFEPSDFCF